MRNATCVDTECERWATMAVRALIRKAGDLVTHIYWDHTDAPKSASHYCADHGMALVQQLAQALTAADRKQVRLDEGRALLEAMEAEHGPVTDEERANLYERFDPEVIADHERQRAMTPEQLVDQRAAERGERAVRTQTPTGWTSTVYRPIEETP